jgi:hypothetical protein
MDASYHRFEFNDYPSEVFYPNNDYYNIDNNETENTFDNSATSEADSAYLNPGPDGWIRKSFEQLTLQNPEPINRPKIPPRSKSLESEIRSNYDSEDSEDVYEVMNPSSEYCVRTDADCDASVVKCDKEKSDLVSAECDVPKTRKNRSKNQEFVSNKNAEIIEG